VEATATGGGYRRRPRAEAMARAPLRKVREMGEIVQRRAWAGGTTRAGTEAPLVARAWHCCCTTTRAASRRAVASVRRFSTTVAVACTNSASWRASSLRRAGRADDRDDGTGDGGGRGGGALLGGDRALDEAGLRDTAAGDGFEAFWDRGGVLAGDRLFVAAWPFAGFFAAASAATAASRSATAASRSDKAASRRPKASAKAEASSPSVWPMPPSC